MVLEQNRLVHLRNPRHHERYLQGVRVFRLSVYPIGMLSGVLYAGTMACHCCKLRRLFADRLCSARLTADALPCSWSSDPRTNCQHGLCPTPGLGDANTCCHTARDALVSACAHASFMHGASLARNFCTACCTIETASDEPHLEVGALCEIGRPQRWVHGCAGHPWDRRCADDDHVPAVRAWPASL